MKQQGIEASKRALWYYDNMESLEDESDCGFPSPAMDGFPCFILFTPWFPLLLDEFKQLDWIKVFEGKKPTWESPLFQLGSLGSHIQVKRSGFIFIIDGNPSARGFPTGLHQHQASHCHGDQHVSSTSLRKSSVRDGHLLKKNTLRQLAQQNSCKWSCNPEK